MEGEHNYKFIRNYARSNLQSSQKNTNKISFLRRISARSSSSRPSANVLRVTSAARRISYRVYYSSACQRPPYVNNSMPQEQRRRRVRMEWKSVFIKRASRGRTRRHGDKEARMRRTVLTLYSNARESHVCRKTDSPRTHRRARNNAIHIDELPMLALEKQSPRATAELLLAPCLLLPRFLSLSLSFFFFLLAVRSRYACRPDNLRSSPINS